MPPTDACPPLRGLDPAALCGSDRQLWGGEFSESDVADGSTISFAAYECTRWADDVEGGGCHALDGGRTSSFEVDRTAEAKTLVDQSPQPQTFTRRIRTAAASLKQSPATCAGVIESRRQESATKGGFTAWRFGTLRASARAMSTPTRVRGTRPLPSWARRFQHRAGSSG